jgi:hypothetical protein
MNNIEEGMAQEVVILASNVIAQMLITVLDSSIGVCTPYLLRNSLGKDSELAFALLDFEIRPFEFGCPLTNSCFQLITGDSRSVLSPLARGTDDRDRKGAQDESGEKGSEFLRNSYRIQGWDKEEIDHERGQNNGDKTGNGPSEPRAAHDGAEEEKDERVRHQMLERERPQQCYEHETEGDGKWFEPIFHRPPGNLAGFFRSHVRIITRENRARASFPEREPRPI